MLGWSDEVRSFIDLSFDFFKIFDLVIFNCFFTMVQISELVFLTKDKQGSFLFSGFFSSAYARTCPKGVFPVCCLTPMLIAEFKEDWSIFPLDAPPTEVPSNATDSAHPFSKNKLDNKKILSS